MLLKNYKFTKIGKPKKEFLHAKIIFMPVSMCVLPTKVVILHSLIPLTTELLINMHVEDA